MSSSGEESGNLYAGLGAAVAALAAQAGSVELWNFTARRTDLPVVGQVTWLLAPPVLGLIFQWWIRGFELVSYSGWVAGAACSLIAAMAGLGLLAWATELWNFAARRSSLPQVEYGIVVVTLSLLFVLGSAEIEWIRQEGLYH